ncbi:MAG: MarR family winged helix-turn-helix transcriptional regulator [Vagococcus sp.]|uniref:MarR family winged helix-turn-helix transcriptional regulator n=1 Tax=Vagococcus sp. TaxID=1933889 RepID=UPI002FCBA706
MSDILREIGIIARALSSISNIEFKDINLNKGQYLFLSRIAENPGIINDDLAELTKVDRTVVAKSVKKLENEGFIVKENDPDNRKIRHLFLTDKGTQAYDYLTREENYSEQQALLHISEIEQQQLLGILKKISQNVAADWDYVKKGNKRNY